MKTLLIIPSLLLSLIPLHQQQRESNSPETLYAMKITFQNYAELQPIFVHIQKKDGRVWGGFSRLSADRLMRAVVPERERVSSIEGMVELVGEKWSINFSVIVGPLVDQEPQRIASYTLNFGETAVVNELSKFQIEPFSISIVKISTRPVPNPLVINDTSSIEVTKVVVSEIPQAYRVTLKNLSKKPVRAISVETLSGASSNSYATRQGSWDRPLIDSEGSYELLVHSSSSYYKQIATNEYEPNQSDRIRISGVLFDDWTYEGPPFLASSGMAQTVGERLQIQRALKLIESALANPSVTVQELKASAGRLQNAVSSSDLLHLKDKFPTLNNLEVIEIQSAVYGCRTVKTDLLVDLTKLPDVTSDAAFRTWLRQEKTKYEKWLSTLP
jgi:hypothetical protein